jgi:pyruvate/2-oxoglutarate dehydrogenase complex dihydrolipoamide acyltransferase (E2) component
MSSSTTVGAIPGSRTSPRAQPRTAPRVLPSAEHKEPQRGSTTMARKSPYLSTAQAAEFMNISPAGIRSAARFARERGINLHAPEDQWPDKRTPLFDVDALVKYRDVQRPNRQWVIPIEEQKATKAKRIAEHHEKYPSRAKKADAAN